MQKLKRAQTQLDLELFCSASGSYNPRIIVSACNKSIRRRAEIKNGYDSYNISFTLITSLPDCPSNSQYWLTILLIILYSIKSKKIMIENKIALGTAQFGMDYGINNKKGKISENEVFTLLELSIKHC